MATMHIVGGTAMAQRQALPQTASSMRTHLHSPCFVAPRPTSHSLGRQQRTEACASEVWTMTSAAPSGPYCPWPRAYESSVASRNDNSSPVAQWGNPATTRGLFTSLLGLFGVPEGNATASPRQLPTEVEALAGGFTDGPLHESDEQPTGIAGLWRYQGLKL